MASGSRLAATDATASFPDEVVQDQHEAQRSQCGADDGSDRSQSPPVSKHDVSQNDDDDRHKREHGRFRQDSEAEHCAGGRSADRLTSRAEESVPRYRAQANPAGRGARRYSQLLPSARTSARSATAKPPSAAAHVLAGKSSRTNRNVASAVAAAIRADISRISSNRVKTSESLPATYAGTSKA